MNAAARNEPGLSRRRRGIAATFVCALLALALAVSSAAGAGFSGVAPANLAGSLSADASVARANVAAIEGDLDRQFARPSDRAPAAFAPDGDVLAEAQAFYQRLMREPVVAAEADAPQERPVKAFRPPAVASTEPAPAAPLLATAERYEGAPYRWGGATSDGLDCSGLVVRAALDLGWRLPHSAAELFQLGIPVSDADLQPGDLVFFANTYKPGISHVGIYKEESQFVQASSAAGRVTVGDLRRPYYRAKYAGARRLSFGGRILATARRWAQSAGRMLVAPWRLGNPSASS
jgi:cell wall-associated NlpC family hydrolase